MARPLADRAKGFRLNGVMGAFAILWLAAALSWGEPPASPSPPNPVSPEAGIRALIQQDLYSGEKIEGLQVVPEPEQSRIMARWVARIVDDGKHFHPLFHPPTIILFEALPGEAHFPAIGTALAPNAGSAPEFRTWQKKLALTRSLMRQVIVLRCMLYCRHQMDALDRDSLKSAEQELSALTVKQPSPR